MQGASLSTKIRALVIRSIGLRSHSERGNISRKKITTPLRDHNCPKTESYSRTLIMAEPQVDSLERYVS